MFGGNSNWRGPVWMPINSLLHGALQRLYTYYGDAFKVECPTGSGRMMTLLEVAHELAERLGRIFLPDESGARPVHAAAGIYRDDPHWRDLILFYEYFHGDTGAGIGASHQTGWTGCIASILQANSMLTADLLLAPGAAAAVAKAFTKRADLMKSYYTKMKLPEPMVPALQALFLLKGQTALVTGANSGIGRAIALSLGRAGANVVVNYVVKPEEAEAVVGEIQGGGGHAKAIRADVGDESQVGAMFAEAVKAFGTVDILVSNAGMERNAPFHEMTTAQWDAVMNVNLRGAFLCAREAVREFLRRGVRPEVSVAAGKIIFISSVHELIPWAGHVNYAASKGGLMLLMKSLAQEVAEKRIRVNSIAPGAIRTPINTAAWATPEAYSDLMKLVPYKRIGEVEEIGRAAVWLASDFTDYLVGTTLYVDGGMTLYPGFETGG